MAALPPNSTPRFRFHYTAATYQHSFQVRSHVSPATLGSAIHVFLAALNSVIYGMTMDFVDWAPAGSDIFNPIVTGVEGLAYGTGVAPSLANNAWAFNFVARSLTGRRTRLAVFGANFLGANYRVSAGENTAIDNARNQLVTMGNTLRAIDDTQPLWKSYVNVEVNDHWVKELR